MTLRRIGRFLIGLVISIILLAVVLPLIGIPKSHFLPPAWVYAKAEGKANGRITGKSNPETGDPFHVGDHLYFVDYKFQAPAPPGIGGSPTPVKTVYTGTVRISHELYHDAVVDGVIPITYEKTYPWINGVNVDGAGRGCGEGSNILSGWIIWVFVSLVMAYIIGQILGRFGVQEDY